MTDVQLFKIAITVNIARILHKVIVIKRRSNLSFILESAERGTLLASGRKSITVLATANFSYPFSVKLRSGWCPPLGNTRDTRVWSGILSTSRRIVGSVEVGTHLHARTGPIIASTRYRISLNVK